MRAGRIYGEDAGMKPGKLTDPGLLSLPLFLAIGLVGCVVAIAVANHFRHAGDLIAFAFVLVAPVAAVMGVFAARTAIRGWSPLWRRLKWWHGLWLVMFVSGLVFRIRDVQDINQDPADAAALFRIALEALLAFVLMTRLALRRGPSWLSSLFQGLTAALAVYSLACVVSSLWSVFPTWTLYKSCEYLVDVALLATIVATVNSTEEYRTFFNWTWTIYGALLVWVWVGAVIWPQAAWEPPLGRTMGSLGVQLSGVLPAVSANDVGTFAAFLGALAFSRLMPIVGRRTDRAWYSLIVLFSLVTMVLSQTRSAIGGFAVGVVLVLFFSGRALKGVMLGLVGAAGALATGAGSVFFEYLKRGQSAEEMETLTKRVDWWAFAWQQFLQQPFTGLGAYAAGRFAVLAKLGSTETSSLHSDYIEMIVGTGFWGLIPMLIALLGTWWLLIRYVRRFPVSSIERQLAVDALAVLGVLTFRTIFMTYITWHPAIPFFVVLGYAEFLRRRSKNATVGLRAP